MIEVQCPNCSTVLEVGFNNNQIFCPNCLKLHQKQFIMIENKNKKYDNLGDGFFKIKE